MRLKIDLRADKDIALTAVQEWVCSRLCQMGSQGREEGGARGIEPGFVLEYASAKVRVLSSRP
jgi:hypothetical protein